MDFKKNLLFKCRNSIVAETSAYGSYGRVVIRIVSAYVATMQNLRPDQTGQRAEKYSCSYNEVKCGRQCSYINATALLASFLR